MRFSNLSVCISLFAVAVGAPAATQAGNPGNIVARSVTVVNTAAPAATRLDGGSLTISNIGSSGLDGVRTRLANGKLVVSNIGSSGQDGVLTEIGGGVLAVSNIGSSGQDGVRYQIGQLMLSNIGATGDGIEASLDGGGLTLSNIGSSGQDGVAISHRNGDIVLSNIGDTGGVGATENLTVSAKGKVTVHRLAGAGTAYACLDSAGTLFRSDVPCR